MIITHKIRTDLVRKQSPTIVDVVQGDNSRILNIEILSDGMPWMIPQDVNLIIRYVKPDGTGGTYDTLDDGNCAWSVEENCVSIGLPTAINAVSGAVTMQITFLQAGKQLSTFTFILRVVGEITAEEQSGDYTNLAQWMEHYSNSGGYAHTKNFSNPHQVTKEQLGLGCVDNTADLNKPVSAPAKEYVDVRTADYIVEQGVQGNTIYRKWASGIAECWGKFTINTANGEGQGAGGSTYVGGISYPFPFANIINISYLLSLSDPEAEIYAGEGNGFKQVEPEYYGSSLTAFHLVIMPPHSGDDTNIPYYGTAHILGTWKDLDFTGVSVADLIEDRLEEVENGSY